MNRYTGDAVNTVNTVNAVLTPDRPGTHAPMDGRVRPGSRADRATTPRARNVLRELAVEVGVCVRPVLLRRTDTGTGETDVVEVPCGSTRAAVCPTCAKKARALRAQQCREGWHLTEEPDLVPRAGTSAHRGLLAERADLVEARQVAELDARRSPCDQDKADVLAAITDAVSDLDDELTRRGVKGRPEPDVIRRRARSTRRRADAPDLPKVAATNSTVGRVYDDPKTGRAFRPSLFLTVTLDSYGRVRDDGTPVDPSTYDYTRAARDALHFGKALDRLVQNLRRVAGYDVQYFAAVEPQKRLAPHAHFAIRGTLPRKVVKQVVAATYTNVWWPTTGPVVYDSVNRPVWDSELPDPDTGYPVGGYVDPHTGQPLMTWAQALDQLDQDHVSAVDAGEAVEPTHCVRFGRQVDVKGMLAGSSDAERAISYLVKYLTKDLGDDLDQTDDQVDDQGASDGPGTDPVDGSMSAGRRARTLEERAALARRADHRLRLVEALRHEPCSPRCANWLRYGIQPQNAKVGLVPGACKAKAHRPSHLGYGGRRVLASRKWTGKDLVDHRHDRKAHVLRVLGRLEELAALKSGEHPDGKPGVSWEIARPTDPDVLPASTRVYLAVAKAIRQRTDYRAAQDALANSATDSDAAAPNAFAA